jgi:phosphoserine phosphatase RsbU/P
VSGHDIGASLLAATIQNTLRHRTLPHVDFRDPAAVMRALNEVFESGKQGAHFFTVWYGVFSVSERILTFSGGGHPPALLFSRQMHTAIKLQELTTSGPPIGVIDHAPFDNSSARIPEGSQLLLYSDGVIESGRTSTMSPDYLAFTKFVTEIANAQNLMDRVLMRCRNAEGHGSMTDDCSLIHAVFT